MAEIEWRDVLNLLGFVITITSLWLAFWQLRKTATAAEASRNAAERMLSQNRDQFRQYVASNLRRFLTELRMFVDGESWDRAALRLDDLAEQLSQLALISGSSDSARASAHSETATAARNWANTCRRINLKKSRFVRTKFDEYVRQVHVTIDAICGPFVDGKEVVR